MPLAVSDLVDKYDKFCPILILLKRIWEIICSPAVHIGTHRILRGIINEYLLLLKMNGMILRTKHYFLIHYSRIMESVGVLWNITSIRFKAKHKESKQVARAACSRVNICRTIAIKHQMQMHYYLSSTENFFLSLTTG